MKAALNTQAHISTMTLKQGAQLLRLVQVKRKWLLLQKRNVAGDQGAHDCQMRIVGSGYDRHSWFQFIECIIKACIKLYWMGIIVLGEIILKYALFFRVYVADSDQIDFHLRRSQGGEVIIKSSLAESN